MIDTYSSLPISCLCIFVCATIEDNFYFFFQVDGRSTKTHQHETSGRKIRSGKFSFFVIGLSCKWLKKKCIFRKLEICFCELSIYLCCFPSLDSTLKAELRHSLDRGPFKSKQKTRCRKELERLIQDNSGECIDPIRSVRKKRKHAVKRKKKMEKVFSCRLCHKDFVSSAGLKIHVKSHKRCRGCKKEFPTKVVLNSHRLTCPGCKKWFKKRVQSSEQKEAVSPACIPSVSPKMHYMQRRVNERTIKCSLCPRTFKLNKALKLHMTRIHRKKENPSNTNEDSSWTMPLELTDTLLL